MRLLHSWAPDRKEGCSAVPVPPWGRASAPDVGAPAAGGSRLEVCGWRPRGLPGRERLSLLDSQDRAPRGQGLSQAHSGRWGLVGAGPGRRARRLGSAAAVGEGDSEVALEVAEAGASDGPELPLKGRGWTGPSWGPWEPPTPLLPCLRLLLGTLARPGQCLFPPGGLHVLLCKLGPRRCLASWGPEWQAQAGRAGLEVCGSGGHASGGVWWGGGLAAERAA